MRARLIGYGLWLEYATLAWHVVGAAYVARSVALAGFGMDSLIEIFASMIVVWQLKAVNKDKEGLALRLIGIAFVVLALYILIRSIYVLAAGTRPHSSQIGIAWLAITFVAMFALAWGKGAVGALLSHPMLQTESKVTLIDAYLAGAVF